MGNFIKYLLAAIALFAAYNEFIMMHRVDTFNSVTAHQNQAMVIATLGNPTFSYNCSTDPRPSPLLYADSLCIDKVEDVYAFPLCLLPPRCHGWNYVAFSKQGRVITKYRLVN